MRRQKGECSMWTIRELKGRGKVAFRANYWKCVLVGLILMLFAGAGGATVNNSLRSTTKQSVQNTKEAQSGNYDVEGRLDLDQVANELAAEEGMSQSEASMLVGGVTGAVIATIMAAAMVAGTTLFVLKLLVFNPLEVGCRNFFLQNSRTPSEIGEIKAGFSSWGRNVLAMFLRGLFLMLWTCLFIIPGIIKSYSYRMVPYILADNPELGAVEAITLSRQMMDGNKGRAFLLDLSFIGWTILTIITLGIVGLFWANPYFYATDAELYRTLKDNNVN